MLWLYEPYSQSALTLTQVIPVGVEETVRVERVVVEFIDEGVAENPVLTLPSLKTIDFG